MWHGGLQPAGGQEQWLGQEIMGLGCPEGDGAAGELCEPAWRAKRCAMDTTVPWTPLPCRQVPRGWQRWQGHSQAGE